MLLAVWLLAFVKLVGGAWVWYLAFVWVLRVCVNSVVCSSYMFTFSWFLIVLGLLVECLGALLL